VVAAFSVTPAAFPGRREALGRSRADPPHLPRSAGRGAIAAPLGRILQRRSWLASAAPGVPAGSARATPTQQTDWALGWARPRSSAMFVRPSMREPLPSSLNGGALAPEQFSVRPPVCSKHGAAAALDHPAAWDGAKVPAIALAEERRHGAAGSSRTGSAGPGWGALAPPPPRAARRGHEASSRASAQPVPAPSWPGPHQLNPAPAGGQQHAAHSPCCPSRGSTPSGQAGRASDNVSRGNPTSAGKKHLSVSPAMPTFSPVKLQPSPNA